MDSFWDYLWLGLSILAMTVFVGSTINLILGPAHNVILLVGLCIVSYFSAPFFFLLCIQDGRITTADYVFALAFFSAVVMVTALGTGLMALLVSL